MSKFQEYLEAAQSSLKINKRALKSLAKEWTWDKYSKVGDDHFDEFNHMLSLDNIKEITGIEFDQVKLDKNDPSEEARVEEVTKAIFKEFKNMINGNVDKRNSK